MLFRLLDGSAVDQFAGWINCCPVAGGMFSSGLLWTWKKIAQNMMISQKNRISRYDVYWKT